MTVYICELEFSITEAETERGVGVEGKLHISLMAFCRQNFLTL